MTPTLEKVAGLLFVAGAMLLAGGCGSSPGTAEERWTRLEVPEPDIVFLGDFSDEERAAIIREVKSIQVHHHERFGVVTSDFTLYVSTERELLTEPFHALLEGNLRRPDLPDWLTCDGLTYPPVTLIALETCDEEVRKRGGPIAHEYFHILQHHVGMVSPAHGDMWPSWLAEGAAVYASTHHAEEQGRGTVAWRRQAARLAWSGVGLGFFGEGFRNALVTFPSPAMPRDAGFLAVEWLVERKGEEALMEYFRLGGGRHEFEEAFGMSPDEFRVAFEEHRQEVAPPFERRIAGQVVNPDGGPIRTAWVSVLVWLEGERVQVVGERTNPYGEFEFNGPGSGYALAVQLICPTRSVVVGEWGEDGFVANEDGRWNKEDEGAKPFTREAHRTGMDLELPETEQALLDRHCE